MALLRVRVNGHLFAAADPQAAELRPNVPLGRRILEWHGLSRTPELRDPLLTRLANEYKGASLQESTLKKYGSSLGFFHNFCDLFGVNERDRLPAKREVILGFAVWRISDPKSGQDSLEKELLGRAEVGVSTMEKDLSALAAWHHVHNEPWTLASTDSELSMIKAGARKLQGDSHMRPPRPPVTIAMLDSLAKHLSDSPFDLSVKACAAIAFYGLARLGEIVTDSQSSFSPEKQPRRRDACLHSTGQRNKVLQVRLPHSKTKKPGEEHHLTLIEQKRLDPFAAFTEHWFSSNCGPDEHIFAYRNDRGLVVPLTRTAFMRRCNEAWAIDGFLRFTGHSFRIGGTNRLLDLGISEDDVKDMGRWKSDKWKVYVRKRKDDMADRIAAATASAG